MRRDIIDALAGAHRSMEQVLTLLRMQLDMLGASPDRDALTFMSNAVFYMHNFPGVTHHPVEEIIFLHLRQRAPDSLALCDRLSRQHKTFLMQETGLLDNLRAARGGGTGASRRLRELGTIYCADHSDHIGAEESAILPQALRHLPEEDWREVESRSQVLLQQMSLRDELRRYETLYDYLMADGGKLKLH